MNEITRQEQETPIAEHDAQVMTFRPPVDIYETADAYTLVADMPGLALDAIDVNLERETLVIEAHTTADKLDALHYKRSFRVMRGLDPAGIKASYQQGVLTVSLPKPESHRPRSITVKSG